MTKHLSDHVDPDLVEYLSICMFFFLNFGGYEILIVYPCHLFFSGGQDQDVFLIQLFFGHTLDLPLHPVALEHEGLVLYSQTYNNLSATKTKKCI